MRGVAGGRARGSPSGGVAGARRAQRGHRPLARPAAARAAGAAIEPPAAPADPETVLLARERRGLVRRALALLPRSQRRAALLRFHGDLPFDSVAERLGTREVTARTRVHRALANLRSRLDGLRAMFVLPGAQTAVLGLTLIAVQQLPAAPSPLAIAGADVVAAVQHPKRRRGGAPDGRGKAARRATRLRIPTPGTSPPCSASCSATRPCSATSKGPTVRRLVVRPALHTRR